MTEKRDGFLILSRKLFASDLWRGRKEPFCSRAALVDLFSLAAYAPRAYRTHGRELHLQPGEFVTNARDLSDRWGWSKSKTVRFLRLLHHRGTLTSRDAWTRTRSALVPPKVYRFTNFEQHQRPWDVVQERGPGDSPGNTELFPDPWSRPVVQGSEEWSRRVVQETVNNGGPFQQSVVQERGPGVTKSGPGDSPANIDDSPHPWSRERIQVLKNTKLLPLSILLESDTQGVPLNPFDTVQLLADLADNLGGPGDQTNPHRGLNVSILVKLIQAGTNPLELAHSIRGTRLLADSGRVPWIEPGNTFSLAGIWSRDPEQEPRHLDGRHLSTVAAETSRQTDPDL